MRQRAYEVREKKNPNIITVKFDIAVPSLDRKYSRLKNKAQVFDDRRKRKPKYKPNYMED
jgi:hypothetical protein